MQMDQNTGKKFESDFKKSIPNYVLFYRLPDAAQSFNQNSGLRFSRKNPFDFLLWDSKQHVLFALEMKTVSGSSISFERSENEKREIHFHQIKGLNQWSKYDGVVCGFIIEFRKIEKTVFIDIKEFNKILDLIPKKSFSYNDLCAYGIGYTVISQKRVRTRYTYGVDEFLKEIKE